MTRAADYKNDNSITIGDSKYELTPFKRYTTLNLTFNINKEYLGNVVNILHDDLMARLHDAYFFVQVNHD
jgi:hypothetical protein